MNMSLLPRMVIDFLDVEVVIDKHLLVAVLKGLARVRVAHFLVLLLRIPSVVVVVFLLEVAIIVVVVIHD